MNHRNSEDSAKTGRIINRIMTRYSAENGTEPESIVTRSVESPTTADHTPYFCRFLFDQ